MRRYANWGLVLFGAILAVAAIGSSWWIPLMQPYLVEEVTAKEFTCAEYVSDEQCDVLTELNETNPDYVLAQMEAMNPENDFRVIDPELFDVARELRESIGSSDQPDPIVARYGVFNPALDAIHNASGEAKIILIVTLNQEARKYLVRLEFGAQGNFSVTNGPNLRIYLSQHPDPSTPEEIFSGPGGALEVGRLKGNSGRQNYDLSADFDPTPYQSLVIYNPDFEQIFGVAPFITQ